MMTPPKQSFVWPLTMPRAAMVYFMQSGLPKRNQWHHAEDVMKLHLAF
jgi:hypothetical protein